MRKILYMGVSAAAAWTATAETLVYKTSLTLYVPRVYGNTESLGYRKIQRQRISGWIKVDKGSLTESGEPTIEAAFTNDTHRVQGAKVAYGCIADDEATMWRYIGSNRTGVFVKPCVRIALDCNPSYNIGADEPDNTLIITLAGRGNTEKLIKGHVTGQIGCACTAYGHVSPTRTIDGSVDDRTPLSGTFTMKLKRRED